jgi:integrase
VWAYSREENRLTLRDGRNTANSLMAASGVPDDIRAAWCGHTVAANATTYTHARPEDMAAALDVLSEISKAVRQIGREIRVITHCGHAPCVAACP